MPVGKSKKFIDKNNSVSFHLVYRSQRDPLLVDENAPLRVLTAVEDKQAAKHDKKLKTDVKEQRKYGVVFEDDYDYLQHLKDVTVLKTEWDSAKNIENEILHTTKINLPSSVFESNVEEKVGVLNKAAPITGLRLDLDPDIVAALDDDYDFNTEENVLEDNFMELANARPVNDEMNKKYEYDIEDIDNVSNGLFTDCTAEFDEDRDGICSLNGSEYSFREDEIKSKFTNYSISSSIMRRNKQLTFLDNHFEYMYSNYDGNEIGALDSEEINGHVNQDSAIILKCAEEFAIKKNENVENVGNLLKEQLKLTNLQDDNMEDNEILQKLLVEAREKLEDCKSILSISSNTCNNPKLITEPKGFSKIKLHNNTGIPKHILGRKTETLTTKSLAQFNLQNRVQSPKKIGSVVESMKPVLSILNCRVKGESSEERKQRKSTLKEYRRERRRERKLNSEAFKKEKKCQESIILNNKQNLQGRCII